MLALADPVHGNVQSEKRQSTAVQQTLSHADTPLYARIDGGGPRNVNYFGFFSY